MPCPRAAVTGTCPLPVPAATPYSGVLSPITPATQANCLRDLGRSHNRSLLRRQASTCTCRTRRRTTCTRSARGRSGSTPRTMRCAPKLRHACAQCACHLIRARQLCLRRTIAMMQHSCWSRFCKRARQSACIPAFLVSDVAHRSMLQLMCSLGVHSIRSGPGCLRLPYRHGSPF